MFCDQVTDRVEDRTSFLANVIYAVFPNRLLRYDYSYMFEYAFHAFTMAKPALKPRWQSLYYPLTDGVWAAILAVVIIMPLPLILVRCLLYFVKKEKMTDQGNVFIERKQFLISGVHCFPLLFA